jgi:hypothetical protein
MAGNDKIKTKFSEVLSNYEWPLVWLTAVTALILGILGFTEIYLERGPLDILYLALQLFVMESGFVDGYVPITLDFARFLAPAVTAYTASKALAVVFRDQLQMVRLKTTQGHTVIAGLGRSGMFFTEAFRKAAHRVVVIEQNDDNDQLEQCRDLGALTLIGDARNPDILSKARIKHAKHLICVAGDDGINAEIAVQAGDVLSNHREALTSLIHIVDSQLCQLLRKQEFMTKKTSSLRVEFFNVYESSVRQLLEQHPAFDSNENPSLLVIGLGQMGESVLLGLSRMWIRQRKESSDKLQITVLDRIAKKKVEALKVRFPYVERNCLITPLDMEISSAEFFERSFLRNPSPASIYVCLDNDSLVLSTALLLKQWLPSAKSIFVRMSHQHGLATLLRQSTGTRDESKLIPFGAAEQICTPALLTGGIKEILARVIHEEFVNNLRKQGATRETHAACCPWEELPDWLKESNRTQADHIGEKLKRVGCDVISFSNEDAEQFLFTTEEIEILARMEHDRWMQERTGDGWKYAAGEKDAEKKTSPYLIPYDQLPDTVKDYNRNTIRELPRFLARAGYQIYRI